MFNAWFVAKAFSGDGGNAVSGPFWSLRGAATAATHTRQACALWCDGGGVPEASVCSDGVRRLGPAVFWVSPGVRHKALNVNELVTMALANGSHKAYVAALQSAL